jgi:hypothetical protein
LKKNRSYWSEKEELLKKSQEAALTAVKVFNDPLILFKSETFIVLMNIAWTYLFHAYYKSKKIEYRYFSEKAGKRKYDRTKTRAYKYWELERCIDCDVCPIDSASKSNLKFLIKIRHEIEHQMTKSLDDFLSGRYQACILNYNQYISKLFGQKHSLDKYLSYSLQFIELNHQQVESLDKNDDIPERIKSYILAYDESISSEEFNSPSYSYRLVFTKKLVNHPGQADRVVEFINPSSELAKNIEKEFWVKREVEKKKYRPKDVVIEVHKAGFMKFRTSPEHTNMWKEENAKDPSKGYGVDVQGSWYWYDSWVQKCIEKCQIAGDRYK